jgi:hypothetical protein
MQPGKHAFGLAASFTLRSDVRQVLANIALGHVVRRDRVDPIVTRCRRSGSLAGLDLNRERACL